MRAEPPRSSPARGLPGTDSTPRTLCKTHDDRRKSPWDGRSNSDEVRCSAAWRNLIACPLLPLGLGRTGDAVVVVAPHPAPVAHRVVLVANVGARILDLRDPVQLVAGGRAAAVGETNRS